MHRYLGAAFTVLLSGALRASEHTGQLLLDGAEDADSKRCKLKSGNYTDFLPAVCDGSATPKVSADGILHIRKGESWTFVGDGSGLRDVNINTSYYLEDALGHVDNQTTYLTSLATHLEIERIVVEPGGSLRLNHLAFTGVIAAKGADTGAGPSKVSLLDCYVRGPANGETAWLVVRSNAALSLAASESRLDRDVLAEQSGSFDAVIETTPLDMTSGFKLVHGHSRIVLRDVRMQCVLYCFKYWRGQHELYVSTAQAAVEYGTGFSATGDHDSKILLNISRSSVRGFAGGASTATGIALNGDGHGQLVLEDVNISDLSTGVDLKGCGRLSAFLDHAAVSHTGTGISSGGDCLDAAPGFHELTMANVLVSDFAKIGLWVDHTKVQAEGRVSILRGGTALHTSASVLQMDALYVINNAYGAWFGEGTKGIVRGLISCNEWVNIRDADGMLACGDLAYTDEIRENSYFFNRSLLPNRLGLWLFLVALPAALLFATGLAGVAVRLCYQDTGLATSWTPTRMFKYTGFTVSITLWTLVLIVSLQEVHRLVAIRKLAYVDAGTAQLLSLLSILFSSICACLFYLYFFVYRRIAEYQIIAVQGRDSQLRHQKDQVVKELDRIADRKTMHNYQLQLFKARKRGDQEEATRRLEDMKKDANKVDAKMSAWFEKRRSEYDQEGSGSRLKTLEAIPDHKTSELVQEEDSLQQHLEMRKQQQGDSYNVEVEAINFFCAKAHWMRGSFEARLSGICDALNKIRSHTELGKLGLDLDPDLVLEPKSHPLQPEPNASCFGDHVGLLVAPVKSKERALEKIENEYKDDPGKPEKPKARYVCDFLRATVFAADPYMLSLAFLYFQQECKDDIVRVKNKYRNFNRKEAVDASKMQGPPQSTCILVNYQVKSEEGEEQIAEVQFILQDYLTAKSVQHLYYEVSRAKTPAELWEKPMFR